MNMRSIGIGSSADATTLFSTVLHVPSLLDADDCQQLMKDADEHIASQRAKHAERYGAPPAKATSRNRIPVAKLGNDARGTVARLLRQTLYNILEEDAPEVALACFGVTTGLATLRCVYTGAEPAINVYKAGGSFEPHQDQQQLTILVTLSRTDAYVGGGTVFWPEEQTRTAMPASEIGHALVAGTEVIVRPEQGDALLWTGNLAHAGLAVEYGTRHILVASFSLHGQEVDDRRHSIAIGEAVSTLS